jgi:predicted nucleic-acid-binding protein
MYVRNMKRNSGGSLDTNILLRLLLDDVPEQTVVVDRMLKRGSRFDIADIALIELIFVLEKVYHFERSHVCENVLSITHNEQFNCNRSLFEYALSLYSAHPKLSIIDCVLLVYARLNQKTPLYTFDKELIRQGSDDARRPE